MSDIRSNCSTEIGNNYFELQQPLWDIARSGPAEGWVSRAILALMEDASAIVLPPFPAKKQGAI